MKRHTKLMDFLQIVGALSNEKQDGSRWREENKVMQKEAQRLNRGKFIGKRGCICLPSSRSK